MFPAKLKNNLALVICLNNNPCLNELIILMLMCLYFQKHALESDFLYGLKLNCIDVFYGILISDAFNDPG